MNAAELAWVRHTSFIVLLLPAAACAASRGESSSLPDSRADARSEVADGSSLTGTQLALAGTDDTEEALLRLRPEYFRGSPRVSNARELEIAVFVDDVYNGGVRALATVPVRVIRRIDFIHPTAARLRFGPNCRCESGAIVVATRAGR
jgi:hypothetical protein